MTSSIFHLFRELLQELEYLKSDKKLEEFPFKPEMVSCKSKGIFPDVILRLNDSRESLTGGELIECKDSKSYTVSSFNSTIPVGTKKIKDVISGRNSKIKSQMDAIGEDINSVPNRDVFYFIRGRNKKRGDKIKVCLVHGSFFCTIPVNQLIQESFRQLFESRLKESNFQVKDEARMDLIHLFSEQSTFSQVRTIEQASVRLRFRIMSEVSKEANILNEAQYPIILDDSVNLILPLSEIKTKGYYLNIMRQVFSDKEYNELRVANFKHNFDPPFLLFQHQIYQSLS